MVIDVAKALANKQRLMLPQQYDPNPKCSGDKTNYDSKQGAQSAANMRASNKGKSNIIKGLRPYYCEDCKAWHLTRRP